MAETGSRYRAHRAVTLAVKEGRLQPASTQQCVDCGGQAQDWDHHLGYAPEHVLDVEARCKHCHNLRHAPERALVKRRSVPPSTRTLVRLKQARRSARFTQKELAEKAGISRVAVARLEAGAESARFSTLRKLAQALGVEPGELVGESS